MAMGFVRYIFLVSLTSLLVIPSCTVASTAPPDDDVESQTSQEEVTSEPNDMTTQKNISYVERKDAKPLDDIDGKPPDKTTQMNLVTPSTTQLDKYLTHASTKRDDVATQMNLVTLSTTQLDKYLTHASTKRDGVTQDPTSSNSVSTPSLTTESTTENILKLRERELHRKIFFAVLGICITASVSLFLIFLFMLIYARSHGWHKSRRGDMTEESIFVPRQTI